MTLDAIAPALWHPISGEVIEQDDLQGIKSALADLQSYLDQPEVKRMWRSRDALQARMAELEPLEVPERASNRSPAQQKAMQCPRCRTYFTPSEPDATVAVGDQADSPDVGDSASSGSEQDAAAGQPHTGRGPVPVAAQESGATPTGDGDPSSQTTLLPEGPRTPEQEAALGINIFGERVEAEPPPPMTATQEAVPSASVIEEASTSAAGASSPPVSDDPVVKQAGEYPVQSTGQTVAQMVAEDPDRCLRYLTAGKDDVLKAALTTYLYAVRPDLLEGT